MSVSLRCTGHPSSYSRTVSPGSCIRRTGDGSTWCPSQTPAEPHSMSGPPVPEIQGAPDRRRQKSPSAGSGPGPVEPNSNSSPGSRTSFSDPGHDFSSGVRPDAGSWRYRRPLG